MGCISSTPQQIINPSPIQPRPCDSRQHQPKTYPEKPNIDSIQPQQATLYWCCFCGLKQEAKGVPIRHCSEFKVPVCSSCQDNRKETKLICLSGHRLYKISDISFIDNIKYKDNVYLCDLCGKCHNTSSDPTYHCARCEFNVCNPCYQQQQHHSQYTCPSGHQILRVRNLKNLHKGKNYMENKYECHYCKQTFSANFRRSSHCHLCNFNTCSPCVARLVFAETSPDCPFQFPKEEKKPLKAKGKEKSSKSETESKTESKTLCVVCLKENRCCVFEPCKHLSTCETCSSKLMKDKKQCPICRARVRSVMKVFIS